MTCNMGSKAYPLHVFNPEVDPQALVVHAFIEESDLTFCFQDCTGWPHVLGDEVNCTDCLRIMSVPSVA